MISRAALSALLALVFLMSCATKPSQPPKLVRWPGSEVYAMPQWTFMNETVELKDGRFRYWFSSDAKIRGEPKYPIEGSYKLRGDELVLSSEKVFRIRQINGRRVLFWPHAVEYWDQRQIIPGHMLLPVEGFDSEPPTNEGFFTKAQIEYSNRRARELSDKSK